MGLELNSPEIKRCVLHQLSQPEAPVSYIFYWALKGFRVCYPKICCFDLGLFWAEGSWKVTDQNKILCLPLSTRRGRAILNHLRALDSYQPREGTREACITHCTHQLSSSLSFSYIVFVFPQFVALRSAKSFVFWSYHFSAKFIIILLRRHVSRSSNRPFELLITELCVYVRCTQ